MQPPPLPQKISIEPKLRSEIHQHEFFWPHPNCLFQSTYNPKSLSDTLGLVNCNAASKSL